MKAAKSDAEISKGTHKEMLNASNKHSNSLPIIQKFLNQNEEIKGSIKVEIQQEEDGKEDTNQK